ncbi:hypothetical protein CLV24_109109 [Pontibacter ummariensis]|uniref:Uncharacterized protein n=1 Tax=Pontibacter ummariensis TaxID=1610492 RepID=A0A239FP28_9BACT|nr:hypothetical protein [Pontibacter ummariensis]PRY11984.1 hypothetical protein CLV24_109109 [Pontibacter ummariensis]SNS58657.1 hypothetical protein SAMN06296052_10961 [Pontibacter ummariensis]
MNNYVVLYYLEDEKDKQRFEEGVLKEYPRHKVVEDGGFKYIGFAGPPEPAVVEKLDTFLMEMGKGRDEYFGKAEYVALYFSREADPDNIKRQLLIGTDEMVDKDAQRMSSDAHRSAIQNLLEFDFTKLPAH